MFLLYKICFYKYTNKHVIKDKNTNIHRIITPEEKKVFSDEKRGNPLYSATNFLIF